MTSRLLCSNVLHYTNQMTNNKPGKTLEDIIYDDVDHFNRMSFIKAAENHLAQAPLEPNTMAQQIEQYETVFRNYYYATQILNDSKNHEFFEEALKELHPTVKIKTPAKNILRLVTKVFVQELAQTCFEVMEKAKKEDVDAEVVQDATKLLEKRRAKRVKFGKLFTQLH